MTTQHLDRHPLQHNTARANFPPARGTRFIGRISVHTRGPTIMTTEQTNEKPQELVLIVRNFNEWSSDDLEDHVVHIEEEIDGLNEQIYDLQSEIDDLESEREDAQQVLDDRGDDDDGVTSADQEAAE